MDAMIRRGLGNLGALLAGCVALGCATVDSLDVTRVEPPAAAADKAGDAALAREPGSDALLFAWVAGDTAERHVLFARSGDGGVSWTAPVRVTAAPGDVGAPHGEAAPRLVAADGGKVGLVWSKGVSVPGRKWPASAIRFSRSLDGGRTWSGIATLNDDSIGAPGTHTFHGVAWTGDSGLVAAWLDERGGEEFTGHHHAAPAPGGNAAAMPTTESDARIFTAASRDFGASWDPNRKVWGAVCPCCRVALARNPSGGVVTAWRQHLPGSIRDVVTAALIPEAAAPLRVHADDWEYPGCPHTGPALAIDGAGVRHVAWYTGKPGGAGVYYARVDTAGRPLGDAVPLVTAATVQTAHPSAITLPGGGTLVAMDVGEDGGRAIRLTRLDAAGKVTAAVTIEGSAGGTYPQLVLSGGGSAIVAWTSHEGESGSVRMARVALD